MAIFQDLWNNEKIRIEQGIFFSDDTFIEIEGGCLRGYSIGNRKKVSHLFTENPDWDFEYCEMDSIIKNNIQIVTGCGSYEGEGFVALIKESKLVWVVHIEDSEPLKIKELTDSQIVVVGAGYVGKKTYTFPLASPEKFNFEIST